MVMTTLQLHIRLVKASNRQCVSTSRFVSVQSLQICFLNFDDFLISWVTDHSCLLGWMWSTHSIWNPSIRWCSGRSYLRQTKCHFTFPSATPLGSLLVRKNKIASGLTWESANCVESVADHGDLYVSSGSGHAGTHHPALSLVVEDFGGVEGMSAVGTAHDVQFAVELDHSAATTRRDDRFRRGPGVLFGIVDFNRI